MERINEEDCIFSEDENTLTIGSYTYIAENTTDGCLLCEFYINEDCLDSNTGCTPDYRKDGRDIIWKLKK